MADHLESATVEQREEYMVSPTGSLPTLRKSYFLRPPVTSIDGPRLNLKLPLLSPKPKWPLEVTFRGWRDPFSEWESWVHAMSLKYSSVWVQAGIYEAVMSSIHRIQRDDEFIFGVAERWLSETNTFIFPWGEATVTLEDVMILGGFSVMGEIFSLHVERNEMLRWDDVMEKGLRCYIRGETEEHPHRWIKFFRGRGGTLEHEGFLVLWLSRYVFPGICSDGNYMPISSMAIHLAKGKRLALAPAVLASIYRDLGLLREAMAESTKLLLEEDVCSMLSLTLWAPLDLVQVWVWERLPPLRPLPNSVSSDDVRLALWAGPKQADVGNMRPAIESAGAEFQWRPYTKAVANYRLPSYYVEDVVVMECGGLSLELESFARCLRGCQLVGTDCQEPYNPHRVAMQFGYDQDLPGWIARENTSPELAWFQYCKAFGEDEILYLPHRAFESDVTVQYLDWWRKIVLCLADPFEGVGKGSRTVRKANKNRHDLERRIPGYDPLAPPGFRPQKLGEENKKLCCLSQLPTWCKVHGDGRSCSNSMPQLDPSSRSYAGSVLPEKKKPCCSGVLSVVKTEKEMKREENILPEVQMLDSVTANGSRSVELRNMKREENFLPEIQVLDLKTGKGSKSAEFKNMNEVQVLHSITANRSKPVGFRNMGQEDNFLPEVQMPIIANGSESVGLFNCSAVPSEHEPCIARVNRELAGLRSCPSSTGNQIGGIKTRDWGTQTEPGTCRFCT